MRLVVSTGEQIALRNVKVAKSHWQKFKGLMLVKDLHPDEGLLIQGCRQIHCCFMRMPIDAIFLSKDKHIVHIVHAMRPWTFSKYVKLAADVLECKSGTAIKHGWRVGDVLHLNEIEPR